MGLDLSFFFIVLIFSLGSPGGILSFFLSVCKPAIFKINTNLGKSLQIILMTKLYTL